MRVELDALQMRGAWAVQQNVLGARQQVERAIAVLEAAEADAATALAGKIPAGMDVCRLRFDQAKGEVWAPAALQILPGGGGS